MRRMWRYSFSSGRSTWSKLKMAPVSSSSSSGQTWTAKIILTPMKAFDSAGRSDNIIETLANPIGRQLCLAPSKKIIWTAKAISWRELYAADRFCRLTHCPWRWWIRISLPDWPPQTQLYRNYDTHTFVLGPANQSPPSGERAWAWLFQSPI